MQWDAVEADAVTPWAVAGTFTNAWFRRAAALAVGQTETFTLRKNGVDTALSVVIPAEGIEASSAVEVTVAPGDTLSFRRTATGSPTSEAVWMTVEFQSGTTTASGYATSVSAGVMNASSARYNALFRGDSQWDPTDSHSTRNVCAVAGNVTDIYWQLEDAPGLGTSYTFAIIKNGVTQDGTGGTPDTRVTIADTATTGNVNFTLAVVVGDAVSVSCTPTGTPATSNAQYAVAFTASSAGLSQFCGRTSSLLNTASAAYNYISWEGGSQAWSATESDRLVYAGISAFRIGSPIVALSGAPSAGRSYTFAGRKNQADGGPTLTISDTSTSGTGTGSMDLTSGDSLGIACTPSGTPTATQASWAFVSEDVSVSGGGGGGTRDVDLTTWFTSIYEPYIKDLSPTAVDMNTLVRDHLPTVIAATDERSDQNTQYDEYFEENLT